MCFTRTWSVSTGLSSLGSNSSLSPGKTDESLTISFFFFGDDFLLEADRTAISPSSGAISVLGADDAARIGDADDAGLTVLLVSFVLAEVLSSGLADFSVLLSSLADFSVLASDFSALASDFADLISVFTSGLADLSVLASGFSVMVSGFAGLSVWVFNFSTSASSFPTSGSDSSISGFSDFSVLTSDGSVLAAGFADFTSEFSFLISVLVAGFSIFASDFVGLVWFFSVFASFFSVLASDLAVFSPLASDLANFSVLSVGLAAVLVLLALFFSVVVGF